MPSRMRGPRPESGSGRHRREVPAPALPPAPAGASPLSRQSIAEAGHRPNHASPTEHRRVAASSPPHRAFGVRSSEHPSVDRRRRARRGESPSPHSVTSSTRHDSAPPAASEGSAYTTGRGCIGVRLADPGPAATAPPCRRTQARPAKADLPSAATRASPPTSASPSARAGRVTCRRQTDLGRPQSGATDAAAPGDHPAEPAAIAITPAGRPCLGPPSRSEMRKSEVWSSRPSPPILAPADVPTLARHRAPAQVNDGRPPGHPPRQKRSTTVATVDNDRTFTYRHADHDPEQATQKRTGQHGPARTLAEQHGDDGAPSEHHGPNMRKMAAHPGMQSRP